MGEKGKRKRKIMRTRKREKVAEKRDRERQRKRKREKEMLLNAAESKTQGSESERTLKTLLNPYKLSYCWKIV